MPSHGDSHEDVTTSNSLGINVYECDIAIQNTLISFMHFENQSAMMQDLEYEKLFHTELWLEGQHYKP